MQHSRKTLALILPAAPRAFKPFRVRFAAHLIIATALLAPAIVLAQNSQIEQLREQIRTLERQGSDVSMLKKILEELEREARRSPEVANALTAQGESGVACLSRVWERSICGGKARASVNFTLDKNGREGTGTYSDEDCTKACSRRFDFKFEVLGETSMQIQYTDGSICGEKRVPNGGQQAWSCRAGQLQFGQQFTRPN